MGVGIKGLAVWVGALALAWGCISEAKPKVVASVADLGAIAREVGGDLAEVEVLARPTQDPHFIDPRPALKLHLMRADLLLYNGVELEAGWLPLLVADSRNAKIQRGEPGHLDCSTLVTPLDVPREKLDRSMGDIHPGGNPHYTKDPRNALPIARAVATRLAAVDPPNAAKYQANLAAFEARLKAKLDEWGRALSAHTGTPVVTFHKSWIYFVTFAGLTEVAFIEPKPGIPPNPQHLINVLRVIRERKVPLILQEDWYSAQASETLAKQSGAKVVRVPGQTPEGKTYLDGMGMVVTGVLDALCARAPDRCASAQAPAGGSPAAPGTPPGR